MAGMFSGLLGGQWSDDPNQNEQARMGALLGASQAIDTYGKSGGRLLSEALGGFIQGSQGERMMQLKERDTDADIAYKRALAQRMGGEHGHQIMQIGLKLHEQKMGAWMQAARMAGIENQPPPPRPDPQQSLFEAGEMFRQFSTSGAGARMGQPAGYPQPNGSPPQPAPVSAPAPGFGPSAPAPGLPQPGAPSAPAPQLLAGAAPQAKTIDPTDASGWNGINRQVSANRPAAESDRMRILQTELQNPNLSAQQRAWLLTEISATDAPRGMPAVPPARAVSPAGAMPPSAPQQAPMTQAQALLQQLQRGAQSAVRYGLPYSKEEIDTAELARGGKIGENQMIDVNNGQIMPMPGATSSVASLEAAKKSADQVTILLPDGSESAIPRGTFEALNQQLAAAGLMPLRTKLSPREVATQQRAPLPINVPSGDPNQPPRLTTEGALFPNGAPAGAGVPGDAAAGGVATGLTANELSRRERVNETRKVDKDTFNKLFNEQLQASQAASATIQTMQAARNIMPADTGKFENFTLPFKQWLADTTGLNEKLLQDVWKGEGFRGLMSRALVGTQEEFKGSVSNVEFQTSQMTLPTLENDRMSNEFLLDFHEAAARKQLWYYGQVARAQQEYRAAEAAGQDFDIMARLNRINALRDAPETDIFNTPAMQRWKPVIKRGQ
jgi:hypothetical protein